MIKTIASLTACCAFVWAVSAGLFLLSCRFLGFSFAANADVGNVDQSFWLYLLSIGGAIRGQMHNTWLFMGAFGALGFASLLWVMAEKWQHGTKWNQRDIVRLAGFEAALALAAILYGLGTNGVLARRFAKSVTVTDVLSIGVAVAVPLILWSQWRRRELQASKISDEDAAPASKSDSSHSILGLEEYSSARLISRLPKPTKIIEAHPVYEPRAVDQPARWLEQALPRQQSTPTEKPFANEVAMLETTSNIVNIDAEPATPEPAAQERAANPTTTFREQLAALNASWQRIEEAGKEVEDWFLGQQKRVLAHLERRTGQIQDAHIDFSHDFIEQKIQRVDAEWSLIHRAVREMSHWLENSGAGEERSEATKAG
jgi:hypothetical protein